MTSEEFFELYTNIDLRQFIVDSAKIRSRRLELQEEFVQEAWLVISCAPSGYDIEEYKEAATKAIYSAYWKNYKEYLLCRTVDNHVKAAKHKTPEAPTDNDKWFMREKTIDKNWRD